MPHETHNAEHWNPGVRFGLGLTIVTACLPGLIPGLPPAIWSVGAVVGLIIMAQSAKPFYLTQKKRWEQSERRMIAIYGMLLSAICFLAFFGLYLTQPKLAAATTPVHVAQNEAAAAFLKRVTYHQLYDLYSNDFESGTSYNYQEFRDVANLTKDGKVVETYEVQVGFYGNFDAGTAFATTYIPASDHSAEVIDLLGQHCQEYYDKFVKDLDVWMAPKGDGLLPTNQTLKFSKRVFIYYESILQDIEIDRLKAVLRSFGLDPVFRGFGYAEYQRLRRSVKDHPDASHAAPTPPAPPAEKWPRTSP